MRASCRARIVDDRSGRPIAKAVVSLSNSEGQKVAFTGPDGRYELRGLTPGTYRVYARADGYVEWQYGQRQPEEAGRGLEVLGGRLTRAINARLRRAGAIAGRIFSRSGEGLPPRRNPTGSRRAMAGVTRPRPMKRACSGLAICNQAAITCARTRDGRINPQALVLTRCMRPPSFLMRRESRTPSLFLSARVRRSPALTSPW